MDVKSEALRLALMQRRTRKQIVDKLVAKGFEPDEAQEAAEYYEELGYIDNRDYAMRYTSDAVRIKGFGENRIRRELKMRGVEEEYIDESLRDIEFDLEGLMKKKFPECEDLKTMKKIVAYFVRRGFAYDKITDTIRSIYIND